MKKQKAPPREDLMKAIACIRFDSRTIRFVKYHRIPARVDTKRKLFHEFLKKHFPGVQHVNYYGGITGKFYRQYKVD